MRARNDGFGYIQSTGAPTAAQDSYRVMAFPEPQSKIATPVTVTLPLGAVTSSGASGSTTVFVNTDPLTVRIVTSVPRRTSERLFPVLIEFSSAALGFAQADVRITGGNISCFSSVDQNVGRVFQVLVQTPKTSHLEISVPAGVVRDNYGNANQASNVLLVDIRDVTRQAQAVWATSTAAFGTTALLSGATSALVAYTSRGHVAPPGLSGYLSSQPLPPGSFSPVIGTHPARNLLGTLFHMQLFAMAERLAVPLPTLFRECAHGLRWTLFQVPLPEDTKLFDNLNLAREKTGAAATTDCAALQQRFLSLTARLGLLETQNGYESLGGNRSASAFLPGLLPGPNRGHEWDRVEVSTRRGLKCTGDDECLTERDGLNAGQSHARRLKDDPSTKPVFLHLNDGELLYKTNPDELGLHHRFDADRAGVSEERIAYGGGGSPIERARHSSTQALKYAMSLHPDWELDGAKRALMSETVGSRYVAYEERSEPSEDDVSIHSALSRWSRDPGTLGAAGALNRGAEASETNTNTSELRTEASEEGIGAFEEGFGASENNIRPSGRVLTASGQSAKPSGKSTATSGIETGASEGDTSASGKAATWTPDVLAEIITYQRRSLLQAPAAGGVPELTPVEFSYLQQWTAGFLSARVNNPGGHAEFRQFWRALIWAVVFLIVLTFLHTLLFAVWRARVRGRNLATGALLHPRFELFLVAVTVAGIAHSSSIVIAGTSAWGLGLGLALLVLWPGLFVVWMLLFLWIKVVRGERVGYFLASVDEDGAPKGGRFQRLLSRKRPGKGYWVSIQPGETKFLSRWGSLFEDTRGLAVVSDPSSAPYFPTGTGTNTPQKTPPRTDGTTGADVGRGGTNKERRASRARVSYRVIELTRVIAYAILLGAFGSSQHSLGQVVAVLAVSIVQVFLLILIRPFISRRLQFVETLSCACEVGIFVCALVFLQAPNGVHQSGIAWAMVALFLLSLAAQLVNQLVALFQQLAGVRRPPASSCDDLPGTVNRPGDTEWATPEPSRHSSRTGSERPDSPDIFDDPQSPETPLRVNRTARAISFE
ncbi:hypothetical protein KFL_002010180 [Klebsormidium nitens]|uniref:Uncharacterized protein n=1 Tax=Klebsormidium nitens TaxID=105231 RepID=A0A0U9HK27_KLENI|nr:hypothetical protein KFL_002010180 [Klebsormidium nitens]|eukprot:GAQ84702.1 hypothetical protein KFL_002010180 [Klebsormidium nitens]